MDVQRSLAAIVFTDVVGFSALCAEDEAAALRLFEEDLAVMRAICARNDGQVLKTMGDGALMVFGSANQAVSSAIEMQKAFGSPDRGAGGLKHRIGIHVGDVRLSQDDAQGDGVNVAARLQQGAPAGKIWISGTVYEIVKGILSVNSLSLGPKSFKNIAHPVPVYELSLEPKAPGKPARKPRKAPTGPFVWAAMFLGLAMIGSAAVVYLASLHSSPEITEVFEEGGKTRAAAPSNSPPKAPDIQVGVKKVVSAALPDQKTPSTPTPQSSLRRLSDKIVPDAKSLGKGAAALSSPSKKVDAPAATNKLVASGKTQPPPSPPSNTAGQSTIAPQTSSSVAQTSAVPTTQSSAQAKPFDPVLGRSRYEFNLYVKWLMAQPDPTSAANHRVITQWRAMANLKKTAEEALYSHTLDAPLLVADAGGSGNLKVWATEGRFGGGHAIVHFQGPDGSTHQSPIAQMSPTQLDNIFIAVGEARFPQPAADSFKRQYQRQLNVFEREYGLNKTTLP